MKLGVYTAASTANPTGRRPWNSRLSFYAPNTFALPTTGRGPFLLNPGASGRPAANGGLGFYKRARFAVPTTSMSGLGQTAVSAPSGARARRFTRAMNPVPAGASGLTPNTLAPGYGSIWQTGQPSSGTPPTAGWAQPVGPVIAGAASQQGFTPIGSSGFYTSSPEMATQAAAQGYYQIGTSRNGQPIYSTNPAQLAGAQGQITSYDPLGAPIYSTPPAGQTVLGTDAYGTPIYSGNPSAASLIASGTATSAAAANAAQAAAATPSTSSVADFFSEDSLGLGLNNGWYLGIGAVALYLITSKRGR